MKRIYSANGKSAPAWFVRAALVAAFPFFVVCRIVESLCAAAATATREIAADVRDFTHLWKSAR